MELKWTQPNQPEAATFENDSSPYAHFWLDQRELVDDVKKRSVVEVAKSVNVSVEDLIQRAFEK